MESKQTTFEKLSAINVNAYTEKKNGLTYLSWANAWSETKKNCPNASYEIKKDENNIPCFGNKEIGYMVYTTVTIDELTHEMWLPVMDFRNKSILNPTTFDINKTIMRCLVKNLAMFGMGIYIYAGEDLPETPVEIIPVSATKTADVPELQELKKDTENWKKVVKYVADNKDLGLEKIEKQINRKYKMTSVIKKEITKLINQ